MAIPIITEQDFEREVLRSELPVIVNFYADRVALCKTVAPEVEAVAGELDSKAKVVKVDIDQSKRTAATLRLQGVPTFMVFVKGRSVAANQGVLSRNQLRELIDPFLPLERGEIRVIDLAQMVHERQVVPVDTRDASSYGRAHIPGAAHMPMEELEDRLAELHMLESAPVLYCLYGDKTKEMVLKLAEQGLPFSFLQGGFSAWKAADLPIASPD